MDIAGTEVLTLTNSAMTLKGTTPTLTIGDAGAEDTKIVFDGNAQDYYIGLDDSADDLIIGKGSTVGTTPAVVIDENLNVGIGGTPSSLLHLGGATNKGIEITSSTSNAGYLSVYQDQAIFSINRDGADGSFADTGKAAAVVKLTSADADSSISFQTTTSNNAEPTPRVTIDKSGNVGIGNTAPSDFNSNGNNLVIGSTSDANSGITLASTTGGNGNIYFADGTSGDAEYRGFIAYNQTNDRFTFGTAGSERMRIDASGNVLVGTTNSDPKSSNVAGVQISGSTMQVSTSGTAMFLNKTSGDGVLLSLRKANSVVGSISTNANSLPSDRNFKKNIGDLDLGLNLVTKLKPSQYNYKIDDEGSPKMFGLIAQDLEESLSAVGIEKNSTWLLQHEPKNNESESDYRLDYLKLTPILIKAIQEQQELIETLTTRIETLEGGE